MKKAVLAAGGLVGLAALIAAAVTAALVNTKTRENTK